MQPNAIEMCIESTDNPLFTSFFKENQGRKFREEVR